METSEVADRRRTIELILERRPDVDLDALSEVLHGLAYTVDEATLLADLDALGFEIHDDPQEGAASTARAGRVEDPRPARPASAGTIPETSGTADASDTGRSVPRSAGLIGAVMVLVGALLVAALLAGRGDDDAETGAPAPTTAAVPSPAPADGAPAPVEATPLGPGADPELAQGGDGQSTFDGPDREGLEGTAPGDLTWQVVAGGWSVAAGQVRLAPVPDGETAMALIDPGLPDYRMQVRLPTLADNVGIAFWANGAGDGWMVVAAPTYSSFNLVRVQGGSFEVVGNTGLTTTKDRTAAIGVHVTGNRVEVLVDGAVLLEHDATEEPPGTAFGLGGLPGATDGSFDDLVYKADG